MDADATSGIQVRVAVESAEACPVAAATTGETSTRPVTWSRWPSAVCDETPLIRRQRFIASWSAA